MSRRWRSMFLSISASIFDRFWITSFCCFSTSNFSRRSLHRAAFYHLLRDNAPTMIMLSSLLAFPSTASCHTFVLPCDLPHQKAQTPPLQVVPPLGWLFNLLYSLQDCHQVYHLKTRLKIISCRKQRTKTVPTLQ
uniref:(northern house mosquito) hypothetical protein n=1 Tax=Culex pipiens TaxID=7175 RepID=A0A8D8FE14_CULPI